VFARTTVEEASPAALNVLDFLVDVALFVGQEGVSPRVPIRRSGATKNF
jgi:hypothetical protein